MGPSQTLKEFQKETTFYQTDLRDILLKQGLITSQYLTCSENNTTKRHLVFEVWQLQCVKKLDPTVKLELNITDIWIICENIIGTDMLIVVMKGSERGLVQPPRNQILQEKLENVSYRY